MPYSGDIDLAAAAALLADSTRVSILETLSDGKRIPAGELARMARVSPSTISAHLAKLVESGLIAAEKQGRYHYYRLANDSIFVVLEGLATFAPHQAVRSLRDANIGEAVRLARTCYNHLAGRLGVQVTQALVEKGRLIEAEEGYMLSAEGGQWFQRLGIEVVEQRKGSLFVPRHIDWSERRYHFAGTLGAAFTTRLFELGWLRRLPGSRAVRLTEEGEQALSQEIDLQCSRD